MTPRRALAAIFLAGVLLATTSWPVIPTSLTVYADFDGTLVACLVDTGAGYTTVRQIEAARMPTLGPTVGAAQLVGAGGRSFVGQLRQIPQLVVPGFVWVAVDLVIVPDGDLPVACLLGADVLGRQAIVIDWRRGELRPLVPVVPTATVPARIERGV